MSLAFDGNSGYLVEIVGDCTCNSYYGQHQNGCGLELLLNLASADLLALREAAADPALTHSDGCSKGDKDGPSRCTDYCPVAAISRAMGARALAELDTPVKPVTP